MLKSKVGYSTETDSFASGKETVAKAVEGCVAPKLGMLYASCKYDEIELMKGAKSVAPDMPIIGCNSSSAIMVPEGIIADETGYSGMIVFDDPDLKFQLQLQKEQEIQEKLEEKSQSKLLKNQEQW